MSAGQPTKGEADAGQPAQDPWIRLRDACAYAFTKADPDQPVRLPADAAVPRTSAPSPTITWPVRP